MRPGRRVLSGVPKDPRAGVNPDREALAKTAVEIKRVRLLVEGGKSAFWGAVREEVGSEGMRARAMIQGHEKMTPEQRAIWLDRFLRYEWFLQIVETAQKRLDMLENKHAILKAKLESGAAG